MNPGDWAKARLAMCSILVATGFGGEDAKIGFVVAKHDCRKAGIQEREIRDVIELALEAIPGRA